MTKRLAFMLAVALGACAGSGTARVDYASSVTVRSPELVTVDADLYTLADSDEPVFYTDNYYWLYRNDRWYRSSHYDRDWVYVSTPAPRLRRIERPTAYIRYRSTQQEARRVPRPEPDHRDTWHDGTDRHDNPTTPPPREVAPPPPPLRTDDRDRDRDHDRGHDHDVRQLPPRSDNRPTPPPARVDDRDHEHRGNTPHDNRGHADDKDRGKKDKDKDKDKKDKKHDH